MNWLAAPEYWWGRLMVERGIAAIYVIAFVCAAMQFRGLLGERGLLPIPKFLARISFRNSPSIFHLHYTDRFFAAVSWLGATLAVAMVAGLDDLVPLWAATLLWLTLWAAYLSIVNVGQTWYSFGWESLLLETGFLVAFLGNDDTAPPVLIMWLFWWLLFRVEFGAGLIKLRGDPCWRNLTCLDYHHETQPMPGPLSWFFHRLPRPVHRIEVAGNHVAQLIVPFGLFAPQPVASIAAAIIVVTQLWLVFSGNFAWLNWLTIVLACSAIDTSTVGTRVRRGDSGRCPVVASRVVCRAGHRGHRGGAGAELATGSQLGFPSSAHEQHLRPPAPGQLVRCVRQHQPDPRRGGVRGYCGRPTCPTRPCGRNTGSRASPATSAGCRGSGARITYDWTG